jgi:hypothetical protein
MMSDPIDFNAERNKRAKPDPAFVMRDDYGRELYTFLISYDMDGKEWSTRVWAYDEADAQARVDAMRQSVRLDGKLFSEVPL